MFQPCQFIDHYMSDLKPCKGQMLHKKPCLEIIIDMIVGEIWRLFVVPSWLNALLLASWWDLWKWYLMFQEILEYFWLRWENFTIERHQLNVTFGCIFVVNYMLFLLCFFMCCQASNKHARRDLSLYIYQNVLLTRRSFQPYITCQALFQFMFWHKKKSRDRLEMLLNHHTVGIQLENSIYLQLLYQLFWSILSNFSFTLSNMPLVWPLVSYIWSISGLATSSLHLLHKCSYQILRNHLTNSNTFSDFIRRQIKHKIWSILVSHAWHVIS